MNANTKLPRVHILLSNSDQVEAFNFLKNECAYNISEVVRQFLMKLYAEEKARRQPA